MTDRNTSCASGPATHLSVSRRLARSPQVIDRKTKQSDRLTTNPTGQIVAHVCSRRSPGRRVKHKRCDCGGDASADERSGTRA